MEKEVLDKYKKAGSICAAVRKDLTKVLKPGVKILEIAEIVDAKIEKLGGKPAFPVNISINDIAAHYTPTFSDTIVIEESDLVKIDVGVHVDGYIGDMAFTYCSEKSDLVKANEKILQAGIKAIKPGVLVSDIGNVIEDAAKAEGIGLIVNLTGHGLDRYVFHGQPSIPNVKNVIDIPLKEDSVVALEPFACQTNGMIKESGIKEIYRYLQRRPVRLNEARKILDLAENEYGGLPFAKRWLVKEFSPVKVIMSLRQLEQVMALEAYPILREVDGKPCSQAEHTIIVKEKPIVTTKPSE
ncbi:MAG: type II methionyl aminopeptidase [Deltaproteobacteria bacterium]|nr:type II methionyl aminopeptidase [Deltaproteobacteria bacterium]